MNGEKQVLINQLRQYSELALHWRNAHYDSFRQYQCLDLWLGLPSTILATVVLGFAFYAVDRPNAPIWTQYTLAILAVAQGVLNAVQMYIRPNTLAEGFRKSAADFGTIYRRWSALEQKALIGKTVSHREIEDIYALSNQVAREARPVPGRIIRKCGIPNPKVG